MTNRAEFQPEQHPLLIQHLQLIEAAERVLHYKCQRVYPNPKLCVDCLYGPLRKTLEKIRTDKTNTIPAVHRNGDEPLGD